MIFAYDFCFEFCSKRWLKSIYNLIKVCEQEKLTREKEKSDLPNWYFFVREDLSHGYQAGSIP